MASYKPISQIIDDYLRDKVDKVVGKSLVSDVDIAKIHPPGTDIQDLSNLVVKEIGKGLSTNDYSNDEKNKLSTLPIITVSATEPQNPTINQIWIDI